jgi:xanthine dehydrogenase accessory factor
MEEVLSQFESLAGIESRVAMATIVATRGTGPRREGAKMWVGEAGNIIGSVTIGGCVDARVIEEAEAALASNESRLLSIKLGEEDAWESGFTCAGTIDVLIETLNLADPDDSLHNLYRAARTEIQKGKCSCVATLLGRPSAKLLVLQDGAATGSLGDPELNREAQKVALDLIQKRVSRVVSLGDDRLSAEVFFEVHEPAPTLIVFGAGQVSMALVSLARQLGLRTIVVDGRPRFATRTRFPDVDELLVGIPSEIAQTLNYTSSTFVVLTAHDYKYDIPVLKIVLKTGASYIGLLSSKRRGKAILKFLEESGVDAQELERVRVPTGLDIGATTASEIALSILAEAVAVKTSHPGSPLRERE